MNSSDMRTKLYRSTDDGFVAGVLSGLSRYIGFDVSLWRLAFLVFVVMSFGTAILLYIAAAFIIPRQPRIVPLSENDYTVL